MPRYFFHTQNSSRVTDTEGTNLADHQAARHEAILTAGQLMRDGVNAFWGTRPWSVTVTNDDDVVLMEISMDGRSFPSFAANDPT